VRLILASASPRRAELLAAAGYTFDVHPVDIDERVKHGESASAYVERLAMEKSARALEELTASANGPAKAGHYVREDGPAKAGHYVRDTGQKEEGEQDSGVVSGFSRTVTEIVIMGADTAVVVGDDILGKPHDVEDAGRMLRRLAGRTHQVMTGVSLRSVAADVAHVEVTSVTFAPLTEDQIAWYVASGEGRDKAGAYAIQGLASRFIPRIEGSYANVVGLPVAVVDGLIRRLSWPPSLLASRE
jgi:septum formation protein